MRAERRAGELLAEMEKNQGAVAGKTGNKGRPVLDSKPKLSDLGISKVQSSRWQKLATLDATRFEALVADAHAKQERGHRNAMREVEIQMERETYRARTEQGCTVEDLESLIKNGKKFGVICPDFPWPFEVYSGKGKQRSADRHYDTWSLEQILALAPLIRKLAADDCVFLPWAVWPNLPPAAKLITACGFKYKTLGFLWLKTIPNAEVIELKGKGPHTDMGYATRANTKPVLLGIKGEPRRLAPFDVHQVVIAPVGEHSAKPDEVYRRIERLYPGPYLELFARRERPHWTVWGDEIPREAVTAAELRREVLPQPAMSNDFPDIPDFLIRAPGH
jgi:N6-adenosine-specific RNA methylase IME4